MLQPGHRIAQRYTIVRELGTGGMGTVYEVQADGTEQSLALKVLSEKFTMYRSVVERFRREAQFQASLRHPGVVRVERLIEDGHTLGIVMEFVSAPTLADVLDNGAMHPSMARAVVADLLGILAACHGSGIAHRDLKPENVFVLNERGRVRCKLADFGVAKLLTPTSEELALTRGNSFVGTPRYASPEQVEQSASIDGRSDLYTLGVMTWEMLTGDLPYEDIESRRKLQIAVLDDPLGPLPAHTPVDLRTLVEELTRKEREERVQSASDALAILGLPPPEHLDLSEPEEPAPPPPTPAPEPAAAAHTFAFEIPQKAPATPTAKPPAPTLPPSSLPAPSPPAETFPPNAPVPKRRQPVAKVQRAGFFRRMGARLIDEMLLQVLVLSCAGIVLYPFVALARGTVGGFSSPGSMATQVRVVDMHTGEPAGPAALLLRNAVDLFTYQWALAIILWPVGWFWFLPVIGIVWLLIFGWLGPILTLVDPNGRRLADRIAGTRVVRGEN